MEKTVEVDFKTKDLDPSVVFAEIEDYEYGADINARNNAGRTPVDLMLHTGREDLAEVLRRHGGESA